MKKSNVKRYRLGNGYPLFVQIIGYIVLIAGIAGTMINFMALVIGLMISGVVSFSSSGVIIDFSQRKIKQYTSFFGIKNGKWRTLNDIPYVCVLFAEESSAVSSQSNRSFSIKQVYYSVFLLNQTHRYRILVKHTKSKEEAVKFAEYLAKELNIEFTVFNPVISAQTASRRYR